MSGDERLVPLSNCPASDDAAGDEGIEPNEFLGRPSAREHAHCPACRLIGKRTDHEQPAIRMKVSPKRTMTLEERGDLGPEIGSGFVEQDVFHFHNLPPRQKGDAADVALAGSPRSG
jgi:hypothetical protein